MTALSRRTFLRAGAAALVAGVTAPATRPVIAAGVPKHLVIVVAKGGWDPTYALDPKAASAGLSTPAGTVEQVGGLSLLTHPSRPSVTEFFTRYSSYGSIVNGLQVRSFIHADCMKRVLTGTASSEKADFGAITAFEHARDLPVPYLVLGSSAKSGPLASITGRAGTTNQISSLLAPPEYAAFDPFSPSRGYLASDGERGLVSAYLDASAERLRATRGRSAANDRQIQAFVDSVVRKERLRDFADAQGGIGTRVYTPDLGAQTEVGVAALAGGLSHSIMLETGDFDTHQDNTAQSPEWEALFAGLITLVESLETRQLLDDTVVVVLSEMGRTPMLNGSGGKDHWPVTSALVLGGGIASGRSLGSTSSALDAQSIDLSTGAAGTAGVQLQTSNFVAGLLDRVGVDPESHFPGVEKFGALAG